MFGLQIRQDIGSFQREMEQLFTGLGWSPEAAQTSPELRFQVEEQGDSYLAQAALPGLDLSQLDISVLGRNLAISGAFSANEMTDRVSRGSMIPSGVLSTSSFRINGVVSRCRLWT